MNRWTAILAILVIAVLCLAAWLTWHPPHCQVSNATTTQTLIPDLPSYHGPDDRILYYFWQTQCPTSDRWRPRWKELVPLLREAGISALPIQADDPAHAELVSYYGVSATPVWILVTPVHVAEFSGTPEVGRLLEFAKA